MAIQINYILMYWTFSLIFLWKQLERLMSLTNCTIWITIVCCSERRWNAGSSYSNSTNTLSKPLMLVHIPVTHNRIYDIFLDVSSHLGNILTFMMNTFHIIGTWAVQSESTVTNQTSHCLWRSDFMDDRTSWGEPLCLSLPSFLEIKIFKVWKSPFCFGNLVPFYTHQLCFLCL